MLVFKFGNVVKMVTQALEGTALTNLARRIQLDRRSMQHSEHMQLGPPPLRESQVSLSLYGERILFRSNCRQYDQAFHSSMEYKLRSFFTSSNIH
jgi:hypothetical protein